MAILNLNLKNIAEKIKKNPKLEFAVYGAIILLALLVYFSGTKPRAQPQDGASASKAVLSQEQTLEERLKNTLEKIEGAGQVDVMISYATSGEIVPAQNVDRQTSESANSESTKPMTVQKDDGEEPMVLYEKQPQVLGAIIVAQGAKDVRVRMDLMRAAQAVLGVTASQVEVFAMREGKTD